MNITVNGKVHEVQKASSILGLLGLLGVNPEAVVIEYNYEVPKRESWGCITLQENDNLEIIKIIGGG